ncbi:MAG: hypothetical protein WCK86_00165 [Planctomycetia bacterium]
MDFESDRSKFFTGLLCNGRIVKPPPWTRLVNSVETGAEQTTLHNSVVRGTPFGHNRSQLKVAEEIETEPSPGTRNRPKLPNK